MHIFTNVAIFRRNTILWHRFRIKAVSKNLLSTHCWNENCYYIC